MKKFILIAALGVILINSSGCARVSPAFDKSYQRNVNAIHAARIARKSDKEKPFDVSQILSRPSTGRLLDSESWRNLMSSDHKIAGDAATQIVSTFSYDEIKQAMIFASPMSAIFKGDRNIDVSRYIESAKREIDAKCQDADTLFQGECQRIQEAVIRASAADGGNSLLAKYNTSVLRQELISEVYRLGDLRSKLNHELGTRIKKVEPRWEYRSPTRNNDRVMVMKKAASISGMSYKGIRHQISHEYADNLKRLIALGIILSAFEDANFSEIKINKNLSLRQWLWKSGYVSADKIKDFVFSGEYWVRRIQIDSDPHSDVREIEEEKLRRNIVSDRENNPGDVVCRTIQYELTSLWPSSDQKSLLLHKRSYLTEGGFESFISNPDKYGLFEYAKIIAPRDSKGYPAWGTDFPADECLKKLKNAQCATFVDFACRVQKNRGAIPKNEEIVAYVKKRFGSFEKDRTAYRFR